MGQNSECGPDLHPFCPKGWFSSNSTQHAGPEELVFPEGGLGGKTVVSKLFPSRLLLLEVCKALPLIPWEPVGFVSQLVCNLRSGKASGINSPESQLHCSGVLASVCPGHRHAPTVAAAGPGAAIGTARPRRERKPLALPWDGGPGQEDPCCGKWLRSHTPVSAMPHTNRRKDESRMFTS